MNDNPLVSVCIPVFNGEKTIDETLQSIINQTYKNIEIIICDNASDDITPELIRSYKDPRISIYTNKKNTGCAERNWDKCIELANGEYIAIFHADDVYLPQIIEKEVGMFQKNPDIGAVFSGYNFIDDKGKYLRESDEIKEFKGKEILGKEEIFLGILKYGNTFLCCPSAMVKRRIYKELYPFRYDQFRSSSDLDMWLRILKDHKIAIIDEKLMNYRISESQGSANINYLRTETSDGLQVLEYYLAGEYSGLDINPKIVSKYKINCYKDIIYIAKNNLILEDSEKAKRILHEYFSGRNIMFMLKNFWHIKYTKSNFFGIILLISIYLKFDRILSQVLKKSVR